MTIHISEVYQAVVTHVCAKSDLYDISARVELFDLQLTINWDLEHIEHVIDALDEVVS